MISIQMEISGFAEAAGKELNFQRLFESAIAGLMKVKPEQLEVKIIYKNYQADPEVEIIFPSDTDQSNFQEWQAKLSQSLPTIRKFTLMKANLS